MSENLKKKLICYTDCNNNEWLNYILAQFCYVQRAKFRFETRTTDEFSETNQACIWYVKHPERYIKEDRLVFPRRELYNTDDYIWYNIGSIIPDEILFHNQEIPIFRGTECPNASITFDPFYNAFIHLSRLEEWEQEQSGKIIHSYAFRHIRKNKKIYSIPVVNYIFLLLEHKIKRYFSYDLFESHGLFKLQLSHDVDYISKTFPLRIKQSAFHLFNSILHLSGLKLKESLKFFSKALSSGWGYSDYWQFDRWQELENKAGVRSIFYVFVRASTNIKRWMFDPSYSVSTNKRLVEKLKELSDNGWEIGLHGSFDSWADASLLAKEKEILENSINRPVNKIRQHWLRFSTKTLRIQESLGFEEDSTIGFNDMIGFRTGIASAYYPYDFERKKAFSICEVPLVLMDSTIFDYGAENEQKIDEAFKMLKTASMFGGKVAIDWHQRVLSTDYNWGSVYLQLVEKFCG